MNRDLNLDSFREISLPPPHEHVFGNDRRNKSATTPFSLTVELAWAPPVPGFEKLVVPVPGDMNAVDQIDFLRMLAFRVSDLIEKQPDPEDAMREFEAVFDEADLSPPPKFDNPLAFSLDLIAANMALHSLLDIRDLSPVDGGQWTVTPSLAALHQLKTATLQEIADVLTYRPRDD